MTDKDEVIRDQPQESPDEPINTEQDTVSAREARINVADEVTKRLNEVLGEDEPSEEGETLVAKPQIMYGISIFWMSNGKPHVEMIGDPTPSLLELQMLLAPALANIEGDITAHKVVELMKIEAKVRADEFARAAMRRKLSGK